MRSRLPLALALALVLASGWALAPGASFSQDKPAKEQDKGAKSMEKAEETGAKVGEPAPDFTLTDLDGNEHHLADYLKEKKMVVLEWFNPDCPFVKKHHLNTRAMAETYTHAAEHEVVWLAINSGGPGKQGAGLERNRKAVEEYKIAYPLLLDEEGTVGKAYGAKTTPHMFIIDKEGVLIYAGAIDNAPNPKELGEVNYVNEALESCLAGKDVKTAKTKSYGCSVKYAS